MPHFAFDGGGGNRSCPGRRDRGFDASSPRVYTQAITLRKRVRFRASVVTFSLTIDHRVLDGADSGAFLEKLAEYLQHPGSVLDDVTAE